MSHKATGVDILLSYHEICPAVKSLVCARSQLSKMKRTRKLTKNGEEINR